MDYECAEYGEKAQVYVRWRTSAFAVLNCRIMFPRS